MTATAPARRRLLPRPSSWSRRRRIAAGALLVLAAALAVNTIVLELETRPAEQRDRGARVVDLPGGDLQVVDRGVRSPEAIVLVHCYTCTLRWWDRVAPALEERHRVVRADLLGHGGSEKPGSGYSMEEQAELLAQLLDRLDVRRATLAGHSLGAAVAIALAERRPELVAGLINIAGPADSGYGDVPLPVRLGQVPVLGHALRRVTNDGAGVDAYEEAFGHDGYDLDLGADRLVDDFRAMTYRAFDDTGEGFQSYTDARPLDDRLRALGVPAMVVWGAEDAEYDASRSLDAFRGIPRVELRRLPDTGHAPPLERPREVAALIERVAGRR